MQQFCTELYYIPEGFATRSLFTNGPCGRVVIEHNLQRYQDEYLIQFLPVNILLKPGYFPPSWKH